MSLSAPNMLACAVLPSPDSPIPVRLSQAFSPVPFAEHNNRSVQGAFACKSIFFSFFPTLLKSFRDWCSTKLSHPWDAAQAPAGYQGCCKPALWGGGYGRGRVNPTNFSPVTNNLTKNSSPSPAGFRSHRATQTKPMHLVQD